MLHHQKTAMIRRVSLMPRWSLSIRRKGAFVSPSIWLFIAGITCFKDEVGVGEKSALAQEPIHTVASGHEPLVGELPLHHLGWGLLGEESPQRAHQAM